MRVTPVAAPGRPVLLHPRLSPAVPAGSLKGTDGRVRVHRSRGSAEDEAIRSGAVKGLCWSPAFTPGDRPGRRARLWDYRRVDAQRDARRGGGDKGIVVISEPGRVRLAKPAAWSSLASRRVTDKPPTTKRESGMTPSRSTTTEKDERKREAGTRKAMTSAQPPAKLDAVARYMKQTRGRLGAGHRLDY